MKAADNPCYRCTPETGRSGDCHAGCPRYAEYCVRLEAARQQRERERRVVSAIISGKPQYVKVGPYWKAARRGC